MNRRAILYSAVVVSLTLAGAFLGFSPSEPVAIADAAPARPKPKEDSNCVRCHLTAGRELTEAVHTFAHSVHDINAGLTCHDCHGGNLEDDAKAHMAEFGFIGTKMSAHLAKCQECHQDQHDLLASGPHNWDHQKRLNIRYPLCVDCHGNHDVGNPPAEFSLTQVCSECHRGFKQKEALFANLSDAEDEMWAAILAWKTKNPDTTDRVPADLNDKLSAIRKGAADIFHKSTRPEAKDVESLVAKMKELTTAVGTKSTASAESTKNGN